MAGLVPAIHAEGSETNPENHAPQVKDARDKLAHDGSSTRHCARQSLGCDRQRSISISPLKIMVNTH